MEVCEPLLSLFVFSLEGVLLSVCVDRSPALPPLVKGVEMSA